MRPAQVVRQVAGEACGTVTKDEERLREAEESGIKAIRGSERRGKREGGREREGEIPIRGNGRRDKRGWNEAIAREKEDTSEREDP